MARWSRIGVVLSAAFLAAAALAGTGWGASPSSTAVWMDAPLDGALTDGPLPVVGHVTSALGLQRIRLDVDGVRVAAQSLALEPGELRTVSFEWQPTSGLHVLALGRIQT